MVKSSDLMSALSSRQTSKEDNNIGMHSYTATATSVATSQTKAAGQF